MRIIYCYKVPVSLDYIAADPQLVDVINVGPFKFTSLPDSKNNNSNLQNGSQNGSPNSGDRPDSCVDPEQESHPVILFNDLSLDDPMTQRMWQETKRVGNMGIDIHLVLGGDRTFDVFFNNINSCYEKLYCILKPKYWITGIDLKITESIEYYYIATLIKLINRDFGSNFKITLTVVDYMLLQIPTDIRDSVKLFPYKRIYANLNEVISWWNVEMENISLQSYDEIIKSGFKEEDICICMNSENIGNNLNKPFKEIIKTIRQIRVKYPNLSAVCVSDYYNAPPGPTPIRWAELMFYLVK